jgi:hypothetical protein
MNAIDQTLASAVERECSILQFTDDHEAKNERLDEMMLREVREARQRIRRIRKAAADEVAAIDAEPAALTARKAEVLNGYAAKVEAENRRIVKCKAYISASE